MIVVLNKQADEKQIKALGERLKLEGIEVFRRDGIYETILCLIGDTSRLDESKIEALPMVSGVTRISDPFKKVTDKTSGICSAVTVGDRKIGDGGFTYIAGPCCVESEEQICTIAALVKEAGANVLRGGAFKPRTSPYSFQGLGKEGIRLLLQAKKETGLPVITEIVDLSHLDLFADVDVIQVGAKNMQNNELLKQLGRCDKPIVLKRGPSCSIRELLMSAEYVMCGGNNRVILCERGIKTFETETRNTMDISAIALLKTKTNLPVIADPSHAVGKAGLIEPMSLASVAAGADGLMIEVHNNPIFAQCDGPQAVLPEKFSEIVRKANAVREVLAQ